MHPLDDAITLSALPEGGWQGRTHPAYANMVGPYGGITAAQVLHAVWLDPRRLGEPVALTVNFCAPLADGSYVLRAQPARTNRSTQHWTVQLLQQDECCATATVFTATRRDTWAADEHRPPPAPRPHDVARVPPQARVAWLDRYEMRFVEGRMPSAWDGGEHHDSRSLLWVRDAPPRPLDHLSLAALADVFFPRIWRRRATPVPVGTVSMTVYFHAGAAELAAVGDACLLAQAQAQGFRGGYFDQSAQLWSEAGALLATTHQVVYYKE